MPSTAKIDNSSSTTPTAPRKFPISFLLIFIGFVFLTFLVIYIIKEYKQINYKLEELTLEQKKLSWNSKKNNDNFHQAQEKFRHDIKNLEKDCRAFPQLSDRNEDWFLLKARHYLELAQINAHWTKDQETTIAMLQEADSLLKNISDNDIFTIRQKLAQEIVQLQSLPKIDVPGILGQLDALEDLSFKLPLMKPLVLSSPPSKESKPLNWKEALRENLRSLGHLIVIRRHDTEMEAFLFPYQQKLALESIQFNLAEAQWAVLHRNQKIYQLALIQAIKKIKRSFNKEESSTKTLLEQLGQLQQQTLSLSLPALHSLLLLTQFINHRDLSQQNTSTKEAL